MASFCLSDIPALGAERPVQGGETAAHGPLGLLLLAWSHHLMSQGKGAQGPRVLSALYPM